LGTRSGYAINLEEVFRAAVANGCFLEINAQPERLDLAPQPVRRAKELGARFVVSTDAHAAGHLEFMRYGVDQARRGRLGPEDVINTRPIKELQRLLKEAKG
jgi:DNA polymerase (family 10)